MLCIQSRRQITCQRTTPKQIGTIPQKNDKQKRQSSPRENWHHDDSIVYNCRLTGRIIPVEVRKEQRHQKSFFDELHIATLMAAPSVGRRSCVEQRKAAALISQNRRWDI